MNLQQYQKVVVDQFRGLYKRGEGDEAPIDHATDLINVSFPNKGEVQTRGGMQLSYVLNHVVRRFFLSTINYSLVPLTLDDSGNLYAGNNPVPILALPGMVDFVALNHSNRTYILPIMSGGSVAMQVWNGTTIRDALGLSPAAGMTSGNSGTAGNVEIGIHGVAVSFITDTGFITRPQPGASVNAPGGQQISLGNIPTGPAGTVGRIIFSTKSNQSEYFFVPGGTINDNVTTVLTINFFNSDLVQSADYLFDQLTAVFAGGNGGIDKYNNRMIVFGGEGNLIRVSRIGEPESFDNVTGYIQLPDERDGNVVSASFQLRDSLYFTKSVGIFVMVGTDNPDPSEWKPVPIDGSVGAISYGVSTISSAQPHLPVLEKVLLADLSGLILFDGTVRTPELTWKIENIWKQYVNVNTIGRLTVCVNPFSQEIYVQIPDYVYLLVGNYSEGLDAMNIKWTIWGWSHIGFSLKTIGIATFNDSVGFGYYLRISFVGSLALHRYDPAVGTDAGALIDSYWQSALVTVSPGTVNVFVAWRARIKKKGTAVGNATLIPSFLLEDLISIISRPNVLTPTVPQKEITQGMNTMAEKVAFRVRTQEADGFILERFDLFGKKMFETRPL